MKTLVVNSGANVLALNPNPKRKWLRLTMPTTSENAANTGIIYMNVGRQATGTTTPGASNFVFTSAVVMEEPSTQLKLDERFKGSIWLNSDTDSQTIKVEEGIEE